MADRPETESLPPPPSDSSVSRIARVEHIVGTTYRTVLHHVKKHVGVGVVCAVAYFDPGNWSVDLVAGSNFGYRPMLFVVLMAGLGAVVLQTLACKLGCVTGLDLASHCRLLLHDRSKHPRLVRRLVLYPLYVLSEIAIISTDLAELLGSAIGLCLIFPKLPLWAGVIVTAADVLIFLAFSDPSSGQGHPVRVFEFFITILVLAVFSCFIVLLIKVHPHWPDVFLGYLPSKGLFQSQPDAVYSAVGILGATVMPHALFLGSHLATQNRVSLAPTPEPTVLPGPTRRPLLTKLRKRTLSLFRVSRVDRAASSDVRHDRHGERENNNLPFIRAHLGHGIVDVVTSLLGLALPINSAILILAAAQFYQESDDKNSGPAGLFEAHELITARIGKGAGFVFALALLCAGQTSSITATLAGQIVSEGFIEWRISPFLRRLITRLLSLVPSVVVAVSVGRDGINTLLVASQVALSVVLPFIAFPLIYLTSSEVVMRVRKPGPQLVDSVLEVPNLELLGVVMPQCQGPLDTEKPRTKSLSSVETLDFSNGRFLSLLSYAIWSVVVVANGYAIVMLSMKKVGKSVP